MLDGSKKKAMPGAAADALKTLLRADW